MVQKPGGDSLPDLPLQHQENMRWMIRVLRITPATNALPAQGLINIARDTRQIGSDGEGLMDEARPFLPLAYGAVLGLVYFRAIGSQARQKWDEQVQKAIVNSLADVRAARITREPLLNAYRLQSTPALLARIEALDVARQDGARIADFFASLQAARQTTFPSEESLSDAKVVGRNPWCLGTAPEFRAAYAQVRGEPGTATPSFLDLKQAQKTWEQVIGAQFTTIIQSKMTEYLGDFLEMAASFLNGAMREAADYVLKIPVVDLLIDWVKERIAEQQLEELRSRYEEDMKRREFLSSLGWGIDPHPQKDSLQESLESARRQALPVQ